jgi:glycerate 2-kinase
VADGGEGTAKVICEALGGSWVSCMVRDPLGRPVTAKYALVIRGVAKTAVIDMSEASGLWRVAPNERCVAYQSTYGTGEMLTHALRCGKADRVVIGLGGSATNDGGMGLAAALGFRFLDGGGLELEPVPANLPRLERVTPPSDLSWISGRVIAAVDVFNPLLGERGATRVYGPQKGLAGETEIRMLEAGLSRLAGVVADWRKDDLRDRPGAGAAGGLGFGLIAFCGAGAGRQYGFRRGGHSACAGIVACSRGRACLALAFFAVRMKTARFFSLPPHSFLPSRG